MTRYSARLLPIVTMFLGYTFAQPAVSDRAGGYFAGGDDSRLWRFKVSLNKKEIGYHDFLVSGQGDQRMVKISADFDVKFLFFNAYSYDHDNLEIWKDGCLQQIESETDVNGDLLKVVGGTVTDGFSVTANESSPTTISSSCVRSFAYWDPAFLESKQLLNSQTGEIVDVDITDIGQESLVIDGQSVDAMRYQIAMKDGPITLWYTLDTMEWLALEAATEGGRTLRYEPIELPSSNNIASVRLAER